MASIAATAFDGRGGAFTQAADIRCELPWPVERDAFALVELVKGLGSQRPQESQFFLLFLGLLFQQTEPRSYDLAGVSESPDVHLLCNESVVAIGEINTSGRHANSLCR